jgi:tricarballylate dehydrogenase
MRRNGSVSATPDVLVVGGGNAALCAAISARHAGASVVLLERAPRSWRGGNSKYTRNIRCVHDDTGRWPGTYTEAELAADLAGVTGDGADGAVTAIAIGRSRDAPEWMEANGIRWQPPMNGALQLSRTNRFFQGGGKALINAYYLTAESLGVEIAYDHVVESFEFDGARCTSVTVRADGATRELRPRAVVVASGGFEANIEWLREYWGEAVDNYVIRGARQNDGIVLRRLIEAGALQRGNPRGFHAVAVDARSPRFEGGIVTRVDSVPFSIMVNQAGERFYDEGEDLWPKRYATWGGLIARQPGQIAYSVFDRRVVGRFITTVYRPYEAETIDELAERIGVPPPALAKTVREYNASLREARFDPNVLDECATDGLDPPKSNWALPIDEPPFFAYALRPGITFTYLGVGVGLDARVLREGGDAFENVFAAGEIMAGNILRRGYLAGFGMTIGTVFGRIAGDEAAAHARS